MVDFRFFDNDGVFTTIRCKRFFVLGNVPDRGVNVCVTFPCESQGQANKVFASVFSYGPEGIEDSVKVEVVSHGYGVPVTLDGGNGHSLGYSDEGTACFFGYIDELFDKRYEI